ncbi:YihY/virulence factor BrkB family protein [Mycoplasmatota bacterium WC44]
MKGIKFLKYLKTVNREYNITLLSAGVSFFIIWAAIPTIYLMIQLVIASDLIPVDEVVEYVNTNLPNFLANYINEFFSNTTVLDGFVLFTFIIIMLWGASKAFNGIMQSAELIYHEKKVRAAFLTRALSLVITLGFVVLFILLIGLTFLTEDLLDQAIAYYPSLKKVFDITRFLAFPIAVFGLLILVLAFIIPRRSSFKEQVPGAIFITVAWYGFSYLFLIYVRDLADYQSRFGPFSSVIALFLWVFVLSYILLLGILLNSLLNRKKLTD